MLRRCNPSSTLVRRVASSRFSYSSIAAVSTMHFSSRFQSSIPPPPPPTGPDAATLAELQALNEGTSGIVSTTTESAVSAAAAASSIPPPSPVEMPTLVKGVDTVLNSIYNAVSWLVPDVTPLLDVGVGVLVSTQAALGIPWTAVLFGFGIAVRLSTLYFTMYGERASLRMQVALPELKQAYHRFELAYYDPSATTKEVMAVSQKLKEQQAEVYSKYGTSNKKASAALLGAPLFVYGFWVAMRTTGTAPGIHSTAWYWLPSLAAPDPFMILPCTVVGITVLNYELLFRKKGGASGTGISSSIVLGVRVAAFSCFWVISNFRAGVLIYWAGVSLTGLLQPLLMRSPWFQRAFNVPAEKDMAAAVEQAKVIAEKASAATVGGKTPTQAFMDKLKEQRTVAHSNVSTPVQKAPVAAAADVTPEPKSSSPLGYKVTSASTGATISSPAAAAATAASSAAANNASAAASVKKKAGYFAPKPGGVAYRILHESDMEKKQKEEAESSESDPLMQRFMFAMPSLSQGVANPQKQQQLAEEIQKHTEKQMEDAKKLSDATRTRSWKGKNE